MEIAWICGWKGHGDFNLMGNWTPPKGFYGVPPNYPESLDAMHEAEKVLTEEQQIIYWTYLRSMTGSSLHATFAPFHL